MSITKLKYFIAKKLDSNLILSHLIYGIVGRFKFLLPHDKSYFGLYKFFEKKNGVRILDVGANNGISALSFKKLYPNSQITSFEPNPRHRKSLERACKQCSGIQFQVLGVGETAGVLTFYQPTLNNVALHTATSTDLNFVKLQLAGIGIDISKVEFDEFTSPVINLDSLDLSPHIIKIDCEGFELPILKGAKETIRTHKPIILTEYSAEISGVEYVQEFHDFISSIGYEAKYFENDSNSMREYKFGDFRSETGSRNIFLIPL